MTTDTMHLTRKQINILEVILKGADNGDFIDLDEMMERLSYTASKQSIQLSVRILARRGLIDRKGTELRRGRNRAVLALTPQALKRFDSGTGEFDIILEGFEEFEDVDDVDDLITDDLD